MTYMNKNILVLLLTMVAMLFAQPVEKEQPGQNDSLLKDVPVQFRGKHLKYNSIADMNKNENLRLGMQTGFVFVDKETRRLLPKAKPRQKSTITSLRPTWLT